MPSIYRCMPSHSTLPVERRYRIWAWESELFEGTEQKRGTYDVCHAAVTLKLGARITTGFFLGRRVADTGGAAEDGPVESEGLGALDELEGVSGRLL